MVWKGETLERVAAEKPRERAGGCFMVLRTIGRAACLEVEAIIEANFGAIMRADAIAIDFCEGRCAKKAQMVLTTKDLDVEER